MMVEDNSTMKATELLVRDKVDSLAQFGRQVAKSVSKEREVNLTTGTLLVNCEYQWNGRRGKGTIGSFPSAIQLRVTEAIKEINIKQG